MLRSCRAERRRGGNQPEPSRRTGLPKSIKELFGKRRHNEARLAAVLVPLHGKRSLCRRGPKWGFISIRFFRCKASFKVSFSSGEDGVILCYRFFKASRMPLHPKKMRDERLLLLYNFFVGKAISSRIFGRAVKVFFSVQIFRQRRARTNQTTT